MERRRIDLPLVLDTPLTAKSEGSAPGEERPSDDRRGFGGGDLSLRQSDEDRPDRVLAGDHVVRRAGERLNPEAVGRVQDREPDFKFLIVNSMSGWAARTAGRPSLS